MGFLKASHWIAQDFQKQTKKKKKNLYFTQLRMSVLKVNYPKNTMQINPSNKS